MLALDQALLLLAAVTSGLVAGVCFTFASFALRAFEALGARRAIAAMQSINAEILRSTTMPIWIGTLLVGAVGAWLAEERLPAVVGVALYATGALVITRRGNIPLNEALDRVDPEAVGEAEAVRAWADYRARWSRWNAWRTAACALASAAFAYAA